MVAFCLRHAVFWCGAVAASGAASLPSSRDGHALGAAQIEARVAATLRGLSVAEKARQLDIFRAADMLTDGRLDPAKAAASWGDLSLGIGTLHDFYPSPELANDAARFLLNASRARVPPLVGGEATHGLQMDGHTIFPSPIGLAATFDPDLMRDYGAVVAREARTSGVHVTWNPVLGLCREPRWGRCEEMMGEDPHLAGALGAATVRGLTDGGALANASAAVAPLLKHFAAYSCPEGGHNAAPAHVGRRELLTTFLPPFAEAMDAGAQAVMASYNEIDGEVNAASKFLLSVLPSGHWRGHGPRDGPFDGFVSSDFGAIGGLVGTHHVAKDARDAIAQWLNAGGAVQGFDFGHEEWLEGVTHGVESGAVPIAVLNAAVARVLRVKARLGLFDQPFVLDTSEYYAAVASPEHEAVARRAACESIVLLQNEPFDENATRRALPLDLATLAGALARGDGTVALVGPNADQPQCGDYAAGGSWGGDKCGGGPLNNARTSSVLGGVKAALASAAAAEGGAAAASGVVYAPGVSITDTNLSAPYFTTVQRHSLCAEGGDSPLRGEYWGGRAAMERGDPPALSRDDHMLSFHFLNYGPDPHTINTSAFYGRWAGSLTPDATVAAARFQLSARAAPSARAALWLDGTLVMTWNSSVDGDGALWSAPVALERGRALSLRFEYEQGDATGTHPAFALQWDLQGGGGGAFDAAVAAAAAADATVLVLGGGTSVTSGEGVDRASLGLPGAQLALAQAVVGASARAGTPLAIVVAQGKPFAEPWIKEFAPAIVEAWQGGQAQGVAIADVLFGRVNPAGRVAVSFAASADSLPAYYNRQPSAKRGSYINPPTIPGGLYPPDDGADDDAVLWAFGHGLSYDATFRYTDLRVAPAVASRDAAVAVTVTVTNNGTRDAEEVVQLYVADDLASVAVPVKQLRGFARVPVRAGASVEVALELDVAAHLWLVDRDYERVVEPGNFTLMIGGASDAIQAQAKLLVVS